MCIKSNISSKVEHFFDALVCGMWPPRVCGKAPSQCLVASCIYKKSLKVVLYLTGHAHRQLVGYGVSGHASWKGPQREAAKEIGLEVTWPHWFAVCAPQNSCSAKELPGPLGNRNGGYLCVKQSTSHFCVLHIDRWRVVTFGKGFCCL